MDIPIWLSTLTWMLLSICINYTEYTTLNKLPHIRSDLVRTDDNWEQWGMRELLESVQQWLKRNKLGGETSKAHTDNTKRERQWFTQKGQGRKEKKMFILQRRALGGCLPNPRNEGKEKDIRC